MIWSDKWKLKLPNVEKNFLWRSRHEILPTCVNLNRRKIVGDAIYPICGVDDEAVAYALWHCSAAKDVRQNFFALPSASNCLILAYSRSSS